MGPPIVQLAVMYVAGLYAGLVFLVPGRVFWVPALIGAAVATRMGWRGILCIAAVLGFATGTGVAVRRAADCSVTWLRGPQAALLQLQDAPGAHGTATASVLHAPAGCGGTLRLRLDRGSFPGGVRIIAVGTYRGGGVLRANHVRVLRGGRSWRFALRHAVSQRVHSLYGARSGLVEAIILGRRDGIDRSLRQNFVNAGLAHLLAISGLHVGILAGWCLILLRRIGARRTAWFWSTAAVWCYVAVLGFPAPATRAAAFVAILGIARVRQRHPPPSAVLVVALLLVLAVDPSAATSVGAWLSAAAVWGTRVGTETLRRYRLLGASLGATIATAPITAFVFGAVAPIGVLANLAAVPLAAIVVPGLFVSLLVGGVVAGGTGLVLAAIEWIAALSGAVPGGHLAGAPGAAFAAPWAMLLGVAVWVTVRRPTWIVLRRRLLVGVTVMCWGLFAIAVAAGRDWSDRLAIHVLAVGQGDAIAVRTPRGMWLLVDGGPRGSGWDAGRRVVLPFFRRHGVTQLAVVIASHGDADHLGGVPAVLSQLTPRLVLDPGQPLGTSLYLEYLQLLDGLGAEWRPARAGDVLTLDSVTFEVLHPSADWMAGQLEPNENSVVLRVSYGCFSAVLTGDIGWPAESALVATVGHADLLKVGHHGSAGSTADAWLDAVRPRAAVISVGPNRYGHPAPSVLSRLRTRDIPVFRTDRGGTVTILSDGRYLEIVQGKPNTLMEALRCLIQPLLRSSGSSWSKSSCTRKRPVSLPICSTTSLSLPRSYLATSGVPGSSISLERRAALTSTVSASRNWTSLRMTR